MRCPTLAELPPPRAGKTDWPWTVESPQLPDAMPDGKPWPRISIVTPSYNQGQFIEETIRSVLLQGYPNLEYVVIDGGSTDNSVDVIKKYQPWLSYWVSEKDRGQAHAINKGLMRSTGHWFQNINSDDLLTSGALQAVGKAPLSADLMCGHVEEFSPTSRYLVKNKNLSVAGLLRGWCREEAISWHQPGVFLKRELLRTLGGYAEEFQYAFDLHLTCRYLEAATQKHYCDSTLVLFRIHAAAKSSAWTTVYKVESIAVRSSLSETLRLPKNRRLAKHEVLRRELHQLIGVYFKTYVDTGKSEVMSLIRFVVSHPALVTDRMFLGAVRRIILAV